jgi:lipopolysaccharide/colanic/teichoic acid biosynthesis glycosyltransferase
MAIHPVPTLDRERSTASPLALAALPAPAVAQPRPALAWPRAKRVADVLCALVLLVLIAPLLLVIAIAIRLDSPGPLLFRQQRIGRGGRHFTVLKFRTMHHGVSPEAHRRYIAQLASAEADAAPGLKKLTSDPRVTRTGALLRRMSFDELPQLVNVVKGEMSIIGPRPALEYELEHYEPEHFERFAVRPGLTGLWQVSGRNTIGFLGMLELDAQYARTTGPRVDGLILLRTPLALLRGNAA